METNQSKNFYVSLLEDLPSAVTNGGTPNSYQDVGKSVGVPMLFKNVNGVETPDNNAKRIEVYNYTRQAFLKGDVVYVSVDNFGIARVTQALSQSGNYVCFSNNNIPSPAYNAPIQQGTPQTRQLIYTTGDSDYNELATMKTDDLSPYDHIPSPRPQYANPFNFRPGPPCLFAPVKGFAYHKTDDSSQQNNPDKAVNMADGYIPVAQDSRLHFWIPKGDTTVYNYGDHVYLQRRNGTCYSVSTTSDYSIVGVCDSEKKTTLDYDFWMPFRVAGTFESIEELTYGNHPMGAANRFGYEPTSAADPRALETYDRADFLVLRNGQPFYSPVFTHLFQVVAGTNYPVAVLWDFSSDSPNGLTAQAVDIPLSESQWLSLYGQGTLKPEICQGDHITCIVDASGSTPFIRPVSFPMDYGAGCFMFWNTPPSARLWVNVTDADVNPNFQLGDIGVFGGAGSGWFNKVALDPVNGTDLNLRAMGGWYKKQRDNSVLVMGTW